MCSAGYIASRTKLAKDVSEFFATIEQMIETPYKSIRPTNSSPFVRLESDGQRHMRSLHWGLIPFWAKDKKFGHATFNARSETMAEKPTFRDPFRKRRGIVPWISYVEWREEEGINVPYEFSMKSGEPLAMAGLWDRWGDGVDQVESCTIITTVPNELTADYQDRMPVILHSSDFEYWLDPRNEPRDLLPLMAPFPADEMVVSRANPDDFRRKKLETPQGAFKF